MIALRSGSFRLPDLVRHFPCESLPPRAFHQLLRDLLPQRAFHVLDDTVAKLHRKHRFLELLQLLPELLEAPLLVSTNYAIDDLYCHFFGNPLWFLGCHHPSSVCDSNGYRYMKDPRGTGQTDLRSRICYDPRH